MWEVVFEIKHKKYNTVYKVTKYPKGYVVHTGIVSHINASSITYKKLDNAIASAKRMAEA
jgi:hypothetical protein